MADREDLHVSNLCDTANVHTTVDEDYYLNVKNIFNFAFFCVNIMNCFNLHCCAIGFVYSSRFLLLLVIYTGLPTVQKCQEFLRMGYLQFRT